MMKYNAVIFDFNGTLFFDNEKHIMAWGEISKELRGTSISDEELHEKINGVPNKKAIQYLLNNTASAEVLNLYSLKKEAYYRKFCKEDKDNFHLVKGAYQYFDFLKQHQIPFTIATASIKPNVDFFVESFDLYKWMDPNCIIYDNGSYDNKVAMFQEAAHVLGVPIEDTLILEDSYSGIVDAYKAGCKQIIVIDSSGNGNRYEKLPGVIKVIKDFTEI